MNASIESHYENDFSASSVTEILNDAMQVITNVF
jgi:hypothetical protein